MPLLPTPLARISPTMPTRPYFPSLFHVQLRVDESFALGVVAVQPLVGRNGVFAEFVGVGHELEVGY